MTGRQLFPAIGRFFKVRPLRADYAKSLASGCFHDHPCIDAIEAFGPELLKPEHLGFNVVSFDVDMHAAGVCDFLDLDVHLSGLRM